MNFTIKEKIIESPSCNPIDAESFISITLDKLIPTIAAGRATASPSAGPMIPISKRALRFGILPSIFITAPKVPKGGRGEGMK